MKSLNDPAILERLDPGNMHGAISGFPSHIREAVEIGKSLNINPEYFRNIDNIIVCGMGGSAIGGEIALSLLYDSLNIPMCACRNYVLPGYAGKNSLVIGSSYSGNTEETIAAFRQARSLDCKLFAITTGGELGRLAKEYGSLLVQLPKLNLQPRAALAYSIVPLMAFFWEIGLSEYVSENFHELAAFLENRQKNFVINREESGNPAKQLAREFHGQIPIIYSGPTLTNAVATRFKGQISENGKILAFANQFPEFNHNELVGWEILGEYGQFLKVVVLRDADDHARVKARMDIITKKLRDQGITVIELISEGENRLERVFSLIQLGDFASYYLGLLNEVDPTPVEAIEFLKKELARHKS